MSDSTSKTPNEDLAKLLQDASEAAAPPAGQDGTGQSGTDSHVAGHEEGA